MKPNDIYNLKPIKTSLDLYAVLSDWHHHIPEIDSYELIDEKNDRVEVRIYYDPYIDGERCMTIGSVYYLGIPIMVFRHAGRSGHDQYDRFITNEGFYDVMVAYLRTLCKTNLNEELVSADQDIPGLDHFYGNSMTQIMEEINKSI